MVIRMIIKNKDEYTLQMAHADLVLFLQNKISSIDGFFETNIEKFL